MLKNYFKPLTLLPLVLGSTLAFAEYSSKKDVKPDNTAVNERDVRGDADGVKTSSVTAQDQARGSASDVETTRKIRSHIVDDNSLSTYAKNVKIVTLNGLVTLKGPVRTAEEKSKVERHARMIVKADQIRNELEVAPSNASAR